MLGAMDRWCRLHRLSGSAYFGETDANVTRTLSVNAFTRTATGNADIDTFALSAEARYGLGLGGGWAAGPVVSVMHADSDLSLDDETGAGSVSLSSADASDKQTRFGAGLFANMRSDTASFDIAAQYVEGASNTVGARLAFADGAGAPLRAETSVLRRRFAPSSLRKLQCSNVGAGQQCFANWSEHFV